jgi:mannosyltransferase OCH1-like enzyme
MVTRTKRRVRRSRRIRRKIYRGGSKVIPRIVVQTAAKPLDENILKQLKPYIKGWDYQFFTDDDILKFFKDHPLKDYPDIAERFTSCKNGENKADIFRIYFLYVKGGVYLDWDLLLKENLDDIIGKKHFISVYSMVPNTIFNGFIASTPHHHILKEALTDAYNSKKDQVWYFHFCAQLFNAIEKHKNDPNVKMLTEGGHNDQTCNTIDPDTCKVLAIHYHGKDAKMPTDNVD